MLKQSKFVIDTRDIKKWHKSTQKYLIYEIYFSFLLDFLEFACLDFENQSFATIYSVEE